MFCPIPYIYIIEDGALYFTKVRPRILGVIFFKEPRGVLSPPSAPSSFYKAIGHRKILSMPYEKIVFPYEKLTEKYYTIKITMIKGLKNLLIHLKMFFQLFHSHIYNPFRFVVPH